MKSNTTKKIAIAGMLIAVGVIGGAWSFPVGASKCAPVQHMVNILAAGVLGPWYGVIMAFITSCIRLAMGTGTLMAFPGSMCGAFLSGVLCIAFRKIRFPRKKNIVLRGKLSVLRGKLNVIIDEMFGNGTLGAIIGELFGTAVIGGILAYPVASLLMGNDKATMFGYIIPFLISTLAGTIIGTIVYIALRKTKALDKMGI